MDGWWRRWGNYSFNRETIGISAKEHQPSFEISEAVLSGETADVYFQRTMAILEKEGINPVVVMEFFPSRAGVFCGILEVKALLERVLSKEDSEVWALPEGASMDRREVALRIKAPYRSYGIYETALCGILSQGSAWATAARECVEAAQGIPIISFGARHVHPSVSGQLDYAAAVGGCTSCSSILGGKLAGVEPSGTMPHTLVLVMGDTVKAALAFDKYMPSEVPRIVLVDTFRDEAEESLNVARALGKRLQMVRLDTPSERGRVTAELVKEVRARLDLEGFNHVGIFVTGGIDPDRIRYFREGDCPIVGFGVGSYISSAPPNDFTGDIHEIEGRPIAKRGRIPGVTLNPRLERIL